MYEPVIPPIGQIATLDDVIAVLHSLIAATRARQDRVGYFACAYRRVSRTIEAMLGQSFFDDDRRIERLAVLFARRYFGALRDFETGGPLCTPPWRLTLEAAGAPELVILQAMTAPAVCHINLDLGVACAATEPDPESLAALQPDFARMNDLLAAIGPLVFAELGTVSPQVDGLHALARPLEHPLIGVGLQRARARSWALAQQLVGPDDGGRESAYQARVAETLSYVQSTISPPLLWRPALALVRAVESRDVAQIIDHLSVDAPFDYQGRSFTN